MIIKNGYVYNTEECRFEKKDLYINGRYIVSSGEYCGSNDDIFDAGEMRLIPGLADIHTHGRAGSDFVSCGREKYTVMAKAYASHGVTAVMPTLASAPLADMRRAASEINKFNADDECADFMGVHLEGRYLNPAKKGAHRAELLHSLTPRELECSEFEKCRSLHITAAFELDNEGAFAAKALEIGATLGLGHTAATYSQAKAAEENGVTSYTHLYNAMPPLNHRDSGAVCAALEGNAFAEIICDGIHVAPEMVNLAYRMKGRERLILISDSMEATDCPDGDYSIAGNPVCVKNGIALTTGGALAGSTLSLFEAVKNLMRFCNIPFEDAVRCATFNPCLATGNTALHGSIDNGKYADILFIDKNTDIAKIMLRGKFIKTAYEG